ncbi:hypothetical protein FDP22_10945 [Paroceanicella profunda]|uniref:Uncharacterized protein n=1 Tax=Paroceanicella profunda TaxID=2579971 RepID=A0A5B8FHQ7_9RHOB|nr:hypothetical protein [Paroceanicella profunda]QDL92248.1 hypothetical protein FDP22_10945 [Paroceanicella profunda]
MPDKHTSPEDPRGLIAESYRMEGIAAQDCRSIYFDWALGMPEGTDLAEMTRRLHARFAPAAPDHPMSAVLAEGAERTAARPERRRRRKS